ncbi:30S ribosomal protein S27ae [Candidatus Micrarchaeota archaeon]|nr:30S ribosomal protein S27ae [Candidatus Micrarchaeota archaeon]
MAEEKKKAAPAPKKKEAKRAYKPGKSCPKCGAGVRLAEHKDRRACGKCGYFERK